MKTIKLVTEGIYLMGYNEKNEACCYYPLTKVAKELDLPLLPNPFEEDVTKLALRWFVECNKKDIVFDLGWIKIFEAGYNAAQSDKQFSSGDVIKAIEMARKTFPTDKLSCDRYSTEEIIQSLSTQQLPKEFIPKFNKNTYMINLDGKEELVGTYKY